MWRVLEHYIQESTTQKVQVHENNAHTRSLFHSSALRNSLHPLPISVSCFLHACSRLFVCGPALKGRPSVWRFLFSLDHRSRKCRAAGISVHFIQQQKHLDFSITCSRKTQQWIISGGGSAKTYSLKLKNEAVLLLQIMIIGCNEKERPIQTEATNSPPPTQST